VSRAIFDAQKKTISWTPAAREEKHRSPTGPMIPSSSVRTS